MTTAESSLTLRWMSNDDVPQLIVLYKECFPLEFWLAKDFNKFMQNKSNRNNVVKSLVDDSGVVRGSLMYTLESDSCRIRRIAVPENDRHKGHATTMMNTLVGPRSPVRRKLFVARVRENNLPAQLFFKTALGFSFNPKRERERDEEQKVDYFEFTFVKTNVPVISVKDD